MLKIFGYMFVCAVAVQLTSCQPISDEEKQVFQSKVTPAIEACAKENSVAMADINAAKITRNTDDLNPCFIGCVFKKIGVITPDGLYDVETGLSKIHNLLNDPAEKAKYEEGGRKCASDTNGELKDNKQMTDVIVNDQAVGDSTGCERGVLLLNCIRAQNLKVPL